MRKMYTLENLKKSGIRVSKKQPSGYEAEPSNETLCFLMQFARSVRPLQNETSEPDYSVN